MYIEQYTMYMLVYHVYVSVHCTSVKTPLICSILPTLTKHAQADIHADPEMPLLCYCFSTQPRAAADDNNYKVNDTCLIK